MNKIFRVIYNRATQSWVAVSELTKAHKKQSSSSAKKSAVKFSGNFIKSSAIALSLLSGSAAYAAETAANGLIQINSSKGMTTATGSDSIAIGKDSKAAGNNDSLAIGHSAQATGNDGALAIGRESKAAGNNGIALGRKAETTANDSMALGFQAKASGDSGIALGNQAKAENKNTVAIGRESKASGESNIALGYQAQADKQFAVAIGKGASAQKYNNAVAIGAGSQANGATSLALGMGSKATGHDSYAIGYGSDSIGMTSIAFGRQSKASKDYDIVLGSEANTRNVGKGYSIAIGVGAVSGSNQAVKNLNGNDSGGVAIGTGAYTGVNKNNISLNSAVAVGAGAGAGYRKVNTDGLPTDNATDADNNATVLVKAFGGTTNTLDYFTNTGKAKTDGFFSFQGVDINEATALGRNARAIGDQSVAIGAQSVAGQGSIVIGGNDIQAYDKKKYFKAANPTSGAATTVNDYDAETTPGTGKKNPKDTVLSELTITEKYKELVGAALDNSYRSSYGQDGSTVIGMQAHSTTPLGVAIGTNSIVRKGAFGATAIGSGASVLANAEAAVAIGMGSEAQGNYAVAAGTAARAEESAVAVGYSSKAAVSSVAVGKGAVSEQVSDIAIGQGAVASGKQGAIAMGLGTIAQGHSSIMIGGSDISTAADQVVSYSREKMNKDGTPELYDGKITEVINGKTVTRTVKLVQTETVMGKKLSDAYREITGYYLNTLPLDYSSLDNKNGHASISMGIHSLSKGAMGVAIGTGARADALGSMALGTGAHASMQNSVAIGTGAVADEVSKGTRQTDISYDEDGNVVETGSAKAKYTFRWAGGINTSEGDVVSFGTPGAERQLKNVAAGRVAEDSTDAVNGSQLNAITRSLSQTITNGWQVGGNNKFRMSNIGSNDRVNFLDGLGTAVNIAEIHQAEDIDGHKLVKIGSDFYKASDFTDGKLNDGAQKVAAAAIKKQPAGANVTFDVKEVNSTLSVTPVGLKVTTGEVTANPDGTMKTPNNTSKANNATVTTAMNAAETALVASQKEWREKNDAYQQTESAYLAADTALTKGKEAVEAIQADIATTQQELKTAQDTLATDKVALTRAENEVKRNPNDTQKQSELNQAKEKVGGSQFVVDQRTQKLAHQQATLTERQNRVSVLEQEKTNAETVRNTAKDAYEVANSDLKTKKAEFDTAKKAFVAAGANQIATVQNVADSINASGWTLQQGTSDKDLVQPGDKVAFVDGDGTTVTVTTDAEKKRSEIKYSVNLGDGLEKTDDNKIKAKAGDGVTVGAGGIKVNTGKGLKIDTTDGKKVAVDADGTTITVDNNGKVTAVTGTIETVTDKNKVTGEKAGQVRPVAADKGKLATVDTVAKAVNSAKWMAKATNTDAEIADNEKTDDSATTGEGIAAGDEVTFTAGKNLRVKRDGKNFTFATDKNVSFDSVKVGAEDTAANGKKPVNLTTEVAMPADNNQTGKAPTTALNISSGTGKDAKPTQITGVGSVLNTTTVTSAPDGTAPTTQPKLVNLGTAHNQTALADNVLNSAATVRDLANMGWKVSSDKVTGAENKSYSDVVRNADEVKFVGTNAAKVSGKTENGVRTITVDVEVPDVKTAKLVSSTDGSVIAPSTDSKLQDALKTAKDELAALPDTATEAEKEAAENKVKVAETALNKALDDKGVATAKNVADMINNSGFTLKTSAAADGKKDDKSTGSEVIKSGKTVEMVAGKNLTVKQEANGKVTYSLNPELSNLTSAEFKADGKPTTKISSDGITITPAAPTTGGEQKPNVSLTENGLNNGGNAITNVAGNLDGARTGTDAPTTSATKPTALTETNAATVGDVLNSGWNIQEKGTAKDFVKAYDTVNFDEGDGTDVSVGVSADGKTSTVKYSVKAADKSLEVGANGVKVKVSDGIETTTNGIAVKTADKTLTVGKDGVKVNTGAIAAANGGKVTVTPKTKADGTTETQAEAETRAASEIATVKNVADAINSAAWIAKVENTDDSVDTPTKNDKGTAVKAGDTLNLKAGKNLKAKRDGQNITFALAKDITVETANVENTLSIGKDRAKVNIASGANGLTLSGTETAADGSTNNNAPIYLNGIKPTLTDTLAGGTTANITANIDATAYHRAASVQDVLNAGWNIRGAKKAGGEVENVDFVRTYDTVDFVSGNKATTDVTVAAEDGGKRAVVTITAKNDAGSITTAGGKVVVGTNGKADTDPKAGDKVAKTGDVANAINQSGWKTNATKIDGKAATDTNKTQLINPGDAVNYENGNGTVANVEVTQGKDGNPDTVSVKYDVKAADKSLEVGADGVKVKVSDGIETTTNGIAVKAADKTLTVGKDGVKVNTGAIAAANGGDDQTANRGKVTVTPKTKADGTTETQAEAETRAVSEIATVKNVADAINSAAWIAKVENTDDSVDTPTENDKGTAVKAGDTLNLKAGKNLRVKRDGGNITFALAKDITVETANVENTLSIGKDGAKVNIAPTANGLTFSRPAATAGGKEQPVTLGGISSGLDKFDATDPKTKGLLNLNKTETGKTEPTVGDNTAATVGDLRGMGWVLSADKETDNPTKAYNAQVKNAEEVKFVGASGVTVSGKTEGNVRTITVGVDHQLATNNSVKPVEYTKKDGTKVYPKTVTNGGKTETKFYPNADGTGDEVPVGDVIVSVNGAEGTKSPTTLSNVKSNLPETRNTADAADPTGKPASKSQSAPTIGKADGNVNANNAATVGDILNSGWNLKGNGSAVDFVRAYDTVNFVNGKGTTVSIETDGKESRVKVDVDTGVITAETKDGKATGKVAGPVANAADLSKAIKDAQDELAKAGDEQAKKAAQTKLDTANKAADEAGLNKVATAQNVADMINNSGFTLKTSATVAADNLTADNTLKNDGEVINPGKTVEMVAGKNLTVKQDAGGKVTYATKDDVEFATVKIGKDEDGKKPVSLTTEAAKEASNNDVANKPATALKISSDGKPAQLVGVASVLNTSEVSTKPNGDKKADGKPAESKTEKLIDLAGTKAPVNKNAAATVGDLQNMGWVVSTKDGNGYTDVVKNADKVDFKGGNGIEVRGSTAADGTRVITVSAKEGKVTNKVEITKNDGSKVHAVIIDGKYYERDENGKPKTDTEIPAADIKAADNGGSGFVTGNTVANAINKSGWNVGLAEKAKADAAFGDSKYAQDAGKPEKVNPDDNVHFANGNNTVVKAATVEEVNKDGKTVTNTYIRVDAELPISQISAVDENGNKVVKDADGNWYPGKADGTADKTQPKVDPAKVRQSASMDPENKGDRYTPLAKRSDDAALTADQKDALSKQQDQYAKDAADKIAEQLKGQPQTVIEAAQKAAAEVARVEAKDKYLKDNGLDKGIGGTVITNVAWGQKPDDAVNVDQLQNSGWNLDSKAVAGSSGKVISGNVSPSKVKMDETVNIDAGNNIEITRNGKNIEIATSMAPQFSSVSLGVGADAPTLSVDGDALNVGSKKDNKPVRITNVAPGVKEGDVTNVAQLKGVAQNLNNRIDNVDGNARAGIAQAIATAGLVQAYLPGKSMMAIGGGTYRGEAGYAIGYSSISDGGNWIIKGTASGNSRGHFGASASVGYQW